MQLYAEEAVAHHLKDLQKSFQQQSNIKSGKIWTGPIASKDLQNFIKDTDRYRSMKEEEATDEEIEKAFNTPVKMKAFSWRSYTNTDQNDIDTVMTPLDSIKYHRAILQSGFMAMDPESGEIKAWVGGPDFRYFKNDHVYKTTRQVGSTFKPFLYLFALMNGFNPNTMLPNEPVTIGNWTLSRNSEGSVGGSISMAGALAKSLNLVSAYLIKQFGAKSFANFANDKIGFQSTKIEPYPSIALGVSTISLYDMLRAYTMFPARGVITTPIYITRIEDRFGNILETYVPEKKEVISEIDAYTMVKMMEGVTAPGGTGARMRFRYNIPGEVAGKTGTTNDNTDGWFLGYTPQLLAGAWVGCDNNYLRFSSTALGQGANTGLPIFAMFMQKVYADKTLGIDPNSKFPVPPNMHNDLYFNYENNIQPGAEAEDVGNGGASDYESIDVGAYGEPVEQQPKEAPKEQKEPAKETPKEKAPKRDEPQPQQQGSSQPKAQMPPKPKSNN